MFDKSGVFRLTPEFLAVLKTLPGFGDQTIFSYEEVATMLSIYIIRNKDRLFEGDDIETVVTEGDLLGKAFKVRAFSRSWATKLMEKQMIKLSRLEVAQRELTRAREIDRRPAALKRQWRSDESRTHSCCYSQTTRTSMMQNNSDNNPGSRQALLNECVRQQHLIIQALSDLSTNVFTLSNLVREDVFRYHHYPETTFWDGLKSVDNLLLRTLGITYLSPHDYFVPTAQTQVGYSHHHHTQHSNWATPAVAAPTLLTTCARGEATWARNVLKRKREDEAEARVIPGPALPDLQQGLEQQSVQSNESVRSPKGLRI
jgi:hypothetical protein